MNVNPSSSTPMPAVAAGRGTEVRKAGPDHDGDADDRGAAPAAAAAKPVANALGQMIGQHVNVKA